MTNDELKEKIVDILVNCKCQECAVEFCATCEGNPYIEHCREKEQADALIAAGIGDVKDVEAEANRYEMLYKLQNRDMALAERRAHDAEHRAARAERALHCLARSFAEALCKNGNAENLIQGFIQDAQKQAEKELAEESDE